MPDIGDLCAALVQRGLGEYAASFSPLHPRRADWARLRPTIGMSAGPLIDLFMLGREIDIHSLPAELLWVVHELTRYGLAEITDRTKLRLEHGLALIPIAGRWLFCNPPGTGSRFYLGDDSVALMLRVMPKPEGQVLDLCSGSGLQSLHCAGFANSVTAVERDGEIATLSRINILLNRLEGRIEVLEGDLFEPVSGRQFDTVIANPPLLPLPDGLPDISIGHGGYDGMRVTARILAGLSSHLRPDGHAHIISACLSDIGLNYIHEAVQNLAEAGNLDVTVTVSSMQDLTEEGGYLQAMAHAVAGETGSEVRTVLDAYRALLRQHGASHLAFLFLLARHGSGKVDITDMSVGGNHAAWHVG